MIFPTSFQFLQNILIWVLHFSASWYIIGKKCEKTPENARILQKLLDARGNRQPRKNATIAKSAKGSCLVNPIIGHFAQ